LGLLVNAATPLAGKTITVTAVNGVGNSMSNKVINLSTSMPVITSISGGVTYSNCDQTFSCSTVNGATTYSWTVPIGATIVSGQGSNSVVVNYGTLTGSQTIKVKAINSCGIASSFKTLPLTQGACPIIAKLNDSISLIEGIRLFPNPASHFLFIENSNNSAIDNVVVVDLSGKVV